MENINLITSEIFISLSLMSLLILGVFKNNSSSIVYNLSIFTLFLSLLINLNLLVLIIFTFLMEHTRLITYQIL